MRWIADVGAWIALAAVPTLGGCAATASADTTFATVDGSGTAPLDVPPDRVHVLVFLSRNCPISRAYASDLQALAIEWRHRPVRLFPVLVDPDLDPAAARDIALDLGLPGTIVLDPTQLLAQAVGATQTPEAAVLTQQGLQYLGRIDDVWTAAGERAIAPEHRDLRDAVLDVLAGNQVAVPRTRPVGRPLPASGR
jgi:hypothetical protein